MFKFFEKLKKMGLSLEVLALLCIFFPFNLGVNIVVHKAKVGETTVLPCPSDDKLYRFQYWQLKNDEIIGPWNNNEGSKLRYEVWSGRLIIKVRC